MAQYTITEEQIKSIAEGGGKKKIKEMFPEVFNPKLEDQTWYIYPDGSIQFNEKDGYGYGINAGKDWVEEARWIRNENNSVFKKATNAEVLASLISEAKRRGFVNGAKYISPNGLFKRTVIYPLALTDDGKDLKCANQEMLTLDGKWAEIIK